MSKRCYAILIPVYNDWESAALLLPAIDAGIDPQSLDVDILFIDDCSTETYDNCFTCNFNGISSVSVLPLKRNVHHQRAIAVGISYLSRQEKYDGVIVMDADGEDRPEDIFRLIEAHETSLGEKIIFAERTKRSEGVVFTLFYFLFRHLFFFLTGRRMRFGNFSLVPKQYLQRLAVTSELWNHYSSAIIKSRIPYTALPTQRGSRLSGSSKMNLISLVIHGLSAIAVYADEVAIRSIFFLFLILFPVTLLSFTVVFIKIAFPEIAIPGWATFTLGILIVIIIQIISTVISLLFFTLNSRNVMQTIPLRDYVYITFPARRIYPHEQ